HLTSLGLSVIIAAGLLCSELCSKVTGQGSSCGHAYLCIPTGSNRFNLIGLPVRLTVRR
ncbi:hypothetical protein QBC32DRAFT_207424, partial [Pseudoneurospora amorphoporcata]